MLYIPYFYKIDLNITKRIHAKVKNFTLLISMLLIINYNTSYSQCNVPTPLPYYQDFQGVTPPALPPCTVNQTIPVHRTTFKWITNVFQSNGYVYVYVDEPDANGNMWFYLPMMFFDATKSYKISYKYRSDNPDPVSAPVLSVYFGACTVNTCMTNLITTGTVSNTSYLIATKNFIPPATGNYYMGFNHKDKIGYSGYSTALDSIVVEVNEPLPVNMSALSFVNTNGIFKLLWHTYTEQNNKGFEVQQSINGVTFKTVGNVPTNATDGNSIIMLSYDFIISQNTITNGAFFRLKQIDKDGKSSFSNIITIGNPVSNMLNITVTSDQLQKVNLAITDQTGRLVLRPTAQLRIGTTQIQQNLAQITKGNYYITITDQQGKRLQPPMAFTKQ